MPGPHDSLNRPRRDLLDQVVRRGERLRLQRRSFLGMAAVSVVLLAVALPLALTAGSGENVQTVGAPITTTTRARPRVRVYHQPTSTTKPESAVAKPGERRKATPKPTVAGKTASKPAAPAPTPAAAKPAGAPTPKPTVAPPAEPSPIEPSCAGTEPLRTDDRGRIAFVRDGQIYTSDQPDNPLSADDEKNDSDPSWSPSGKKLVIARAGSLYVMDATTGNIDSRLTDPPEGVDSDPAWSPDGKRIAFVRQGDIYVKNAEPAALPKRLTNMPGDESSPAWSPESCRIAFAASDGKIHEIQDSGQGLRALINGKAPTWSLSNTIAWDLGGDIRVYNGEYPIRGRGTNPSWSAGSDALVFESDGGIYTVKNVDGDPPQYIGVGTDPAW